MRNDEGDSPTGKGWEDIGFTLHGNGGGLYPSDDRDRLDGILSEIQGLQDPEELENPEQSNVSNGYWETIAEATARPAKNGVRDGSLVPVDGGITLETLIPKAMRVADAILDMQLNQDDPNFARMLSAQKDMATAVFNTAQKADENQFKKRKSDVLEKLLAAIRKEKPVITIEGTAHQERCSNLGSGARRSHSEGECAAASWKNAVS